MKLIVLMFFVFGVCSAIYIILTYLFIHFRELKKINWIAFGISAFAGLVMITLLTFVIYTASKTGETWCTIKHYTNSYPPDSLTSAMDYFEKGNYEYDRGNCDQAIADYSTSIDLNPNYPQAFNNRAYTYMKMGNFKSAINDLNFAIALDPNYLHALRNRADVNAYRLNNKQAAISDYEKIIELSGPSNDVCAHLADAKNLNNNPWAFIATLRNTINCSRGK